MYCLAVLFWGWDCKKYLLFRWHLLNELKANHFHRVRIWTNTFNDELSDEVSLSIQLNYLLNCLFLIFHTLEIQLVKLKGSLML